MNKNDVRFQNEESCTIIPNEYWPSIEYWLKKNRINYDLEGSGHKPEEVELVFFEEDGLPRYNYLSCLYTHVVAEDMMKVVNAIVFDRMVSVTCHRLSDEDGNPIGEMKWHYTEGRKCRVV